MNGGAQIGVLHLICSKKKSQRPSILSALHQTLVESTGFHQRAVHAVSSFEEHGIISTMSLAAGKSW